MSEPESRSVEVPLATIWIGAATLLVAVAVGVGGYLYGKSTGEDLDAARAAGIEAGQRKGAAKGAAEGYAAGFKRGREIGFERTYPRAYRQSYVEEFEQAGLEPPEPEEIAVSSP